MYTTKVILNYVLSLEDEILNRELNSVKYSTLVVLCFFPTEHNDLVHLDILGSGYVRIKNLWEYKKNYQYIIKRWYNIRDKKIKKRLSHWSTQDNCLQMVALKNMKCTNMGTIWLLYNFNCRTKWLRRKRKNFEWLVYIFNMQILQVYHEKWKNGKLTSMWKVISLHIPE